MTTVERRRLQGMDRADALDEMRANPAAFAAALRIGAEFDRALRQIGEVTKASTARMSDAVLRAGLATSESIDVPA